MHKDNVQRGNGMDLHWYHCKNPDFLKLLRTTVYIAHPKFKSGSSSPNLTFPGFNMDLDEPEPILVAW